MTSVTVEMTLRIFSNMARETRKFDTDISFASVIRAQLLLLISQLLRFEKNIWNHFSIRSRNLKAGIEFDSKSENA